MPVAHIVLNPQYHGNELALASELDSLLSKQAQTYIHIEGYVFRNTLPFTSRGKIDYQKLIADGLQGGEDRTVIVNDNL